MLEFEQGIWSVALLITRVKWLAFIQPHSRILGQHWFIVYLLFYVAFNSQGHIATGSLQVEETVNHRASASNYQLFNMKRPAQDSNRWPQRLEERTLTATPLIKPPRTALGVEICKLGIIAHICKPLPGKLFSDLCSKMGICSDVM